MTATGEGSVAMNTRVLSAPLTGVQRYVRNIVAHLPVPLRPIHPRCALRGISGHVWEQCILPARLGSARLWSPSNTGPLAVKRQVVTVHDVVPLDHPEWLNPKFAAWYRWLLPRLLRRVERIIAISDFTRDRILARTAVEPDRIVVIRHGIDRRFAPQSRAAVEIMLTALQIPSPRYFFCLGSLEPRKNLAILLQAWGRVQDELDPAIWLVIGGERGAERVFAPLRLPPDPPRTYWTGRVPDELLPAAYTGALGFIYPSVYEGFGAPPLEAMACGTPVIAGNRTALPEVVGNAGLLVDPLHVDDLCQALLDLARDGALRSRLRAAGLQRAAGFDWRETGLRTWEALQGG